jgi:hypothetical protein
LRERQPREREPIFTCGKKRAPIENKQTQKILFSPAVKSGRRLKTNKRKKSCQIKQKRASDPKGRQPFPCCSA